jgi:hypothetical protein
LFSHKTKLLTGLTEIANLFQLSRDGWLLFATILPQAASDQQRAQIFSGLPVRTGEHF